MKLKKGLRPHTPDPRDLRLVHYFDHTEVTVPAGPFSAAKQVPKSERKMYGNGPDDSVKPGFLGAGDCFPTGFANAITVEGREGGHKPDFDALSVLKTYSAITGYVLGDESTDTGTEPRRGLKHMQKTGIFDAEGKLHRIGSYVWLEKGDYEQLVAAVYEFEVVGVGDELPDSAEQQFDRGEPWSVVKGSPIDGGHWTNRAGRDAEGNLEVETWADVGSATPEWDAKYMTCGAVWLSHADLNGEGKTPKGFDFERLAADLKALG